MEYADILILGAGCAGLAAGLYGARAGKRTVILERQIPGGQAALTAQIENYPGLPTSDGVTLTRCMAEQAVQAGARIVTAKVEAVEPECRWVRTDGGEYTAGALIIATGAEPRKLGIPGEERFFGRGVSYCATCDGFAYRGRETIVVGGGNSACEEALHLAGIASRVRLLARRELRCDAAIRAQLAQRQNIEVLLHTELVRIEGGERIESVVLRDNQTGKEQQLPARGWGVFIFIGYRPASELFAGKLDMDAEGWVLTDDTLATSAAGVFAAGDVRQKELRQIVTAAADGAQAAFQACKFLEDMVK